MPRVAVVKDRDRDRSVQCTINAVNSPAFERARLNVLVDTDGWHCYTRHRAIVGATGAPHACVLSRHALSPPFPRGDTLC